MAVSWYRSPGHDPARPLIILLPGRGSDADELRAQGFVQAALSSGKADVAAVNATQGYYMRRTLIPRLLQDVIRPAQQAGYHRLWIAGISMGGLGAVLTAEKQPGLLEGILLMAPFLGEEEVIEEISLQGGLSSWRPPAAVDLQADYQRALWSWLKRYAQGAQSPKLYLGFGDHDRFDRSNALLAAVLPDDHVFRVPGDHDWGPWREVFARFMQSDALVQPAPQQPQSPPAVAGFQNAPNTPAP